MYNSFHFIPIILSTSIEIIFHTLHCLTKLGATDYTDSLTSIEIIFHTLHCLTKLGATDYTDSLNRI